MCTLLSPSPLLSLLTETSKFRSKDRCSTSAKTFAMIFSVVSLLSTRVLIFFDGSRFVSRMVTSLASLLWLMRLVKENCESNTVFLSPFVSSLAAFDSLLLIQAYVQSPISEVHSSDGGHTFSSPQLIVGNVL